ncbi:MAG TPA: hypothetical protein VLZ77_13435 [Acidimicrobiales bacterium]|nr:hypothetical protein [Acidimicrobiales bacterium]
MTLQSMQRRHELYAALKAYGPFHLARVIPQVALLALAEMVVATLAGHRARAAAVAHAWRWNLSRRRTIRRARAEVRAHRRLSDAEVRRLQLHGSARVNAYVRRAFTHGIQAANVGGAEGDEGVGAAPAEAVPGAPAPRPAGDEGPATSTKWAVWLAAALVVVVGTRQLLGSGFPVVGQLLPFPSWATLVHRFASGWQPTGVGSTDPATPATGLLGVAGMVLFGAMGLLQKIVVLGCIPVGALGMARLSRPLGTAWARVVSTVIYLAVPVPYDALASGRWDALVVYAACPWILHLLGQASRVDPYGSPAGLAVAGRGVAGRPPRRWRTTLAGWSVALGLLDAVVTSVAPSGALVTLVVAAGLALGSVVVGGRGGVRAAGRVVVTALGATAVAVVLLAPWSLSVLAAGGRWQVLAGLPVPAASGAGWGELLRLAAGPIGDAALAWMFLAAAALPLVIGTRWRLAWAGRAWTIAVVAWVVAWVAGRGWLGSVGLAPQVLVAPAAMAIALSVGLGVSAFQLDLPGYRFGWRQAAAVAAAAAAAVGMLPVLAGSLGGRWDLVPTGYGEATSWMATRPAQGGFRVLWLGDPRVLPGTGWALSPGLAYTLSTDGLPDVTDVWSGASPGAASGVGAGVELARRGATVRLGRLLAPYAVRYVVVVDTLAPSVPGLQTPVAYHPPSDLVPALRTQVDLRQIISEQGFEVFEDPAALPLRAVRSGAVPAPGVAAAVAGAAPRLSGWRPALTAAGPAATSVTGRVPGGTVLAATAPAGRWQLRTADGAVARATTAFGYAPAFALARGQVVTLRFAGTAWRTWELTGQIAAWVVVTAALLGRRRWLDWWWGPVSGRRRARADGPPTRPPSPGAGDAQDGDPARATTTAGHDGRVGDGRAMAPLSGDPAPPPSGDPALAVPVDGDGSSP